MFPVSGAEQLKTSGAHQTRPMTSHRPAYSRFESPGPNVPSGSLAGGRNRFHRPSARALGFSSSMIGRCSQRFPDSICRATSASLG